jgi:hypothetical protein
VAADFFIVEVWTAKGLQRFVVLFFIDLSTRRVEIAGISVAANGLSMSQIARNLTDTVDGLLTGKRYLIHDRDPIWSKYSNAQKRLAGVRCEGWHGLQCGPKTESATHTSFVTCNVHRRSSYRAAGSCAAKCVNFGASGILTIRVPLTTATVAPDRIAPVFASI